MKISRRAFLGILLIGIIFFTGILLRDFILENFVQPIALVLWMFNRTLASIDQSFYWAAVIMVGLLIIAVRLAIKPLFLEKEDQPRENATLRNMSHWRTLILVSSDDVAQPNFLKQNLMILLKDIYASKYPDLAGWEINEALEQGDIPLPGNIRNFLLDNKANRSRPTLIQRFEHLIQAPNRWRRHWTGQDIADYYRSVSEVISFFEKQLENENDNDTHIRNNY